MSFRSVWKVRWFSYVLAATGCVLSRWAGGQVVHVATGEPETGFWSEQRAEREVHLVVIFVPSRDAQVFGDSSAQRRRCDKMSLGMGGDDALGFWSDGARRTLWAVAMPWPLNGGRGESTPHPEIRQSRPSETRMLSCGVMRSV